METNGSSPKSQEIGSKRKWKTTADLSPHFCSNQHQRPWEGGTTRHIACYSSGYQGDFSQAWPPWNHGSLPTSLGRQKDFLVSGDRFFLAFNPYQQNVESRYLQDKMNGIITCLVCGKEGHYTCDCPIKDQGHKVICTVCSKNGHCSMWCCQQNKSENHACTRCGEIGHTASTHGLSCSSCDEYHPHGECRLRKVKCFICECQDHYLAQCPLNSVLNAALQDQRENFQAALRLALSKQGNTLSTPAECSAKSAGKKPISSVKCFSHLPKLCPSKRKVLTANKSSPIVRTYNTRTRICFTCREEGHFAFECPQKSGSISPDLSKEFEESSTISTSSNLSKELEDQDPGTSKQSSEMKPILYDQCYPSKAKVLNPDKSSPIVRTCKTKKPGKKRICFTCREEGHYANQCPQKFGAISGNLSKEVEESSTMAISSNLSKVLEEQDPGTAKQSSEMKPTSIPLVTADNTPTRVFTCFSCNEEGHYARQCPQKHRKR